MDAQRGIARRMVIGLPREGLSPAWEKDFAAYPPAGVILFRRDFADLEALRRLTLRLRELAAPRRLFLATDEEGGFVSQLGGLLEVPPAAALLARGAAPGDLEAVSRVTGERLRALGIDWVFAPVADIHSEPRNPVIGPRAYGTTAADVTARLAEVLAGFRAARVAACLKHFPGHGDTTVDSHLALPRCDADAATLEQRELVPFRTHADADAVMSAHLVVPALDPERRPATFSPAILRGVLREQLGFAGVCITDALEMKGAAEGRTHAEAGRLALGAGADLLLYAFHDEEVRRTRLELARDLTEGRIDRAGFDAARPRLAAFDARTPPPSAAELERPLESLTPDGWSDRLAAIVDRGLVVDGAMPHAATWSVNEPAHAYGPAFRDALAALGARVTGDGAADAHVELVASRVPLAAAELERLQARCASGPTVVVALQADGFLAALPAASARVSACDPTPVTRRAVARRLLTPAA